MFFSVFQNFLKYMLGESILQNKWVIWFPLLYFNLKKPKRPNSTSLIRFQRILHDLAVLYSVFQKNSTNSVKLLNYFEISKFLQIMKGGTNSSERLKYLVPLTIIKFSKFEGLKFDVVDQISMYSRWFSRTFLSFLKFPQVKEGGLNF